MDNEVTKDFAELADARSTAPVEVASAATKPTKPVDPMPPLGNGARGCAPGDSSPNGTIVDGMKKVIVANVFGPSCHWEPVKK